MPMVVVCWLLGKTFEYFKELLKQYTLQMYKRNIFYVIGIYLLIQIFFGYFKCFIFFNE